MTAKRERHVVILELIDGRSVATQEDLRRLLRQRGLDVTQSTLSRDVHELRLARVPTADGVRYARAEGTGGSAGDSAQPSLELLVPQLVTALDGVSELLVIRTPPGGAQTVARALDGERVPDIVGTIAGDDTILVVCRSVAARERLTRRVSSLVGGRA